MGAAIYGGLQVALSIIQNASVSDSKPLRQAPAPKASRSADRAYYPFNSAVEAVPIGLRLPSEPSGGHKGQAK